MKGCNGQNRYRRYSSYAFGFDSQAVGGQVSHSLDFMEIRSRSCEIDLQMKSKK